MFVVVDRDGSPVFLEHLDVLLKELVARVENLAFVVPRVVPVLDDAQDCIDREFVAAASQCFSDRRVNLEAELLCALLAEIAFRLLVDI